MMGRSLRDRYIFFTTLSILFIFLTSYYLRTNISEVSRPIVEGVHDDVVAPTPTKYHPKYKPTSPAKSLPIVDNFPLALHAHSAAELPPVASWNKPPTPHVPENTPLFIGFTRNWRLLQQVVVSYITSGWPPEDIYVVENTGVMDSNKQGRLSLQNPFFLNHTRLEMLGVNVLVTPTLLTFAQLQSYYIFHSISQNWTTYFWSHMDVVALSFEDQYNAAHRDATPPIPILPPSDPKHDYSDYKSVYTNCLNALRKVLVPDPDTGKMSRWAMRFFSYDRLALVNVAAFVEVGGWDTLIPFYMTDCDMHARLEMAKFDIKEVPAGLIYDVASSMEDLIVLYRKKGPETPEASFKDPNAIEEELKAIAESEEAAKKAGFGNDEVKAEKRDDEEKTEERKGEAAWEKFAEGQLPPGATGEVKASLATTSTSTSTPAPTETSTNESSSRWEEDTIYSPAFEKIAATLDRMQNSKHTSSRGRNTWQSRQVGGQGDPFYRDSEGFEIGIGMTIEHGRAVFREKWGHRDCDIAPIGLMPSDAWKVEHDWD